MNSRSNTYKKIYNTCESPSQPSPSRERLTILDTIRGITLINMILYHFLWDLVYIADIDFQWYKGRGAHIWQQCICWTFIFLSGFCWSLGRHHLKRGLTVYLSGGLVTIVTLCFMPDNRVIFGVLTLLGSSMLLMIPLDIIMRNAKHIISITFLFAAFGLLFITFLPAANGHLTNFAAIWGGDAFSHGGLAIHEKLYHGWINTYLGFPSSDFYSTDYFPIIPWFLLFVTGYLFYRLCDCQSYLKVSFWRKDICPPISFIGRHSLLIYMLHQPVLYGITMCIIYIRR